jgi:NitT/TauT family transport system ATP-binding protein
MSGASVMISMESGTKAFGEVVAFENLSFEVRENECLCLVGPSGCGKTTLLRVIDGLTPLTSGVVSVGGKVVDGPIPEIAMVFQHFGLFPWMTVEDNVAYGLRVKGVPMVERLQRAAKYIELVGLQEFQSSYPYQLSGGMQQRVGLARALTLEPTVLLMDEPFASVDAQTRVILQEQLLEIWERERRTMVFITHSIEEAILMGDRVAVLSTRPGRVKDTRDIPVGHPRRIADILEDPRFGELRNRVWAELKSEASAELKRKA